MIMPAMAPVLADAADDVVELGMGQRLAAGDADHGGAQAAEVVDAAVHLLERDRLGDLVVLVAVGAGQVAEAHGDDLRQHRVSRILEGAADHLVLRAICVLPQSCGRAPYFSGELPFFSIEP